MVDRVYLICYIVFERKTGEGDIKMENGKTKMLHHPRLYYAMAEFSETKFYQTFDMAFIWYRNEFERDAEKGYISQRRGYINLQKKHQEGRTA